MLYVNYMKYGRLRALRPLHDRRRRVEADMVALRTACRKGEITPEQVGEKLDTLLTDWHALTVQLGYQHGLRALLWCIVAVFMAGAAIYNVFELFYLFKHYQ